MGWKQMHVCTRPTGGRSGACTSHYPWARTCSGKFEGKSREITCSVLSQHVSLCVYAWSPCSTQDRSWAYACCRLCVYTLRKAPSSDKSQRHHNGQRNSACLQHLTCEHGCKQAVPQTQTRQLAVDVHAQRAPDSSSCSSQRHSSSHSPLHAFCQPCCT